MSAQNLRGVVNVAVTVVKQSKLDVKLRDPAFARLFQHSRSPGPVGADLGITRQGVYDLIKRGRLDAIRLVSDRGTLLALVIPDEAVDRYRECRYQRA